MNKKQIALLLIVPYYLLADVELNTINISETVIQETNTVEVDLEQNEQWQSNSVYDILKNESSVELAGGGASTAKRIYVRGVESSTLDVSLDGASQGSNIFQHRSNEVGINPDILKVVNVKTAPDASNGGALGGAIEMSTKDAKDFVKNGKTTGGIVKVGYNTNTNSKTGSLTAYGLYDEHYGVVASVSSVNSENYSDGDGEEMYATAYQDRNYFLKLTLDDIDNHDLKISVNRNSNGGDMLWGKDGSDKGPTDEDADLETIVSTTTNYTLQHNYSKGNLLNLETKAYFTNVEVDREDEDYQYDNDTLGLKVKNDFYLDAFSTKNKISVGAQIENKELTSNQPITSTNASNDPSSYASVSSSDKALFVQSKTTIGSLDISYGIRFDSYTFESGLGDASDSTFSPNFGLKYRLTKNSNIYANYGQSSRMSGTMPFTWIMNVSDGATYSEDLKAETSTKYELGYELKVETLFTDADSFIFNANIFQTEIEDLIYSYSGELKGNGGVSYAGEGGAPITDLYNSDYTYRLKGFEIKGTYYIDNYSATLSYTQIDTNVFDEKAAGIAGEPLAVRSIGGWDSKKVVLNLGSEILAGLKIDYTLTGVADLDNSDQITRDGYITHDISTQYQPSKKSPWTFYVAVTNITDEYYANHNTLADNDGDYRRDIGRDFKFSVKYVF
jgi:hemoglobin/transferrin/lactoferrin receptor protein